MDLFFGLRLSSTPTSPNWKLASTSATGWPCSAAMATARLTASVVRPTPPLGEKRVMTRPGFARRRGGRDGAVAGRLGQHPARASRARGRAPGGSTRAQLVGAERLDQELAGAGEHRAAQVVRLALDAHHHDRRASGSSADSCSVVAMPSMPGMLMSIRTTSGVQPRGSSSASRPEAADADDLDVGLEREQLGEVLARLGDVVDDDDAESPRSPCAPVVRDDARRRPRAREYPGWMTGPPAHRVGPRRRRIRRAWATGVPTARLGNVKAGSVSE